MTEDGKRALVLGISGGIGGAVARALIGQGWQVRGLARDVAAARLRLGDAAAAIEWRQGDAMNRDDVVAAAADVSALVHAVNPPDYRNWDTLVLPMLDNSIAAARAAGGARIVLPGTVYNYDPSHTAVISTGTPPSPIGRKGRIRVEMERRLKAASAEAPALIVRAGDFFSPDAGQSWFSQAMIAPGKPVRRINSVGALGVGHA